MRGKLSAAGKRSDKTGDILAGKSAVLFDWDGTLADSMGIWTETDMRLLRAFGGTADPADMQRERDDALRRFRSKPDPYLAYSAYLKERYGWTQSPEEIRDKRYELSRDLLENEVDYKPYADTVVRRLKAAGYALAIVSTTRRSNMDIYRTANRNIIGKADIDTYFSYVCTAEDVANKKPDPEAYLQAMRVLGMRPDECLAFEDSLAGVEAAVAAGIETVAVYDAANEADRARIEALADHYIAGFADWPANELP